MLAHIEIESFPSALAIPLAALADDPHPQARLWHMCETVELGLRLATAFGIAEALRSGPDAVARLRGLIPNIDRPTLGEWKSLALKVTSEPLVDRVVPELKGWVVEISALLEGKARDPKSSLLELRNALAHGAITKTAAIEYLECHKHGFVKLVESSSWLSTIALIAQDSAGSWLHLRGSHEFLPYPHIAEASRDGLLATVPPGGVAAGRNGAWLDLYPLHLYARARGAGPTHEVAERATPQLYRRKELSTIHMTPLGSDQLAISILGDEVFSAFERLFPSVPDQGSCTVPGFETSFARDAAEFVGRSLDLEKAHRAIEATASGVLWISGAPGIGKSYFMAKLVMSLQERLEGTCVIPYRFKRGHAHSSRWSFAELAVFRLRRWLRECGYEPLLDSIKNPGQPYSYLKEHIRALPGEMRVIIVLDGLDEIISEDPSFATDVPLGLAQENVLWVCAGRNEEPLRSLMSDSDGCRAIFSSGLEPMKQADVREMLFERLEAHVSRLLKMDREQGDKLLNPFVDRVVENSQGLPIYVRYVIGDVLAGQIEITSQGVYKLPRSLEDYHAELLKRCAIGDLQQVLTPLLAMLALAKEPLSVDTLKEMLVLRGLVPSGPEGERLTIRALGHLDHMLRLVATRAGGLGYSPYHDSLRQHVLQDQNMKNAVMTAQAAFAQIAEKWEVTSVALADYALAHGVQHLVAAGSLESAVSLLGSFDYLMRRVQVRGAEGWYQTLEDHALLERADGLAEDTQLTWSREFAKGHAHRVFIGGAEALWHITMALPSSSPMLAQAEAWHQAGRWEATWICRTNRVVATKQAVGQTLRGHEYGITAIACHPSQPFLVSGDRKGTLRVWDLNSGRAKPALAMQTEEKIIALAWSDTSDTIAAISWFGEVEVWRGMTGESLGSVSPGDWSGRDGESWATERFWLTDAALRVHDDGSVLISTSEGTCRWHPVGGQIYSRIPGGEPNGLMDGENKSMLTFSKTGEPTSDIAEIWQVASGEQMAALPATSKVVSAAFSVDGTRLLTSHADKMLRVWSLQGEPLSQRKGPGRLVNTVFLIDGNRLALCIEKKHVETVNLEDPKSKPVELFKSDDIIRTACLFRDGSVLTVLTDAGAMFSLSLQTGEVQKVYQVAQAGGVLTESSAGDVVVVSDGNDLRILGRHEFGARPLADNDISSPVPVQAVRSDDGAYVVSLEQKNQLTVRNGRGGDVIWRADDVIENDACKLPILMNGDTVFAFRQVASKTTVRAHRLGSGETRWQFELEGRARLRCISYDKLCLSLDDEARVITADGALSPHAFVPPIAHEVDELPPYFNAVALSEDGQHFIGSTRVNDDNESLTVWNAKGGEMIHCVREPFEAVVPDGLMPMAGGWVLALCKDGIGRLLELETGVIRRSWSARSAWHAHKPGQIILRGKGADSRTLGLYDANSDLPLRSFPDHPAVVQEVLLLADGRRLIARAGTVLRIWDTETGELLQELAHDNTVEHAALTGDGKHVVTSSDLVVSVWSLDRGERLARFYAKTPITVLIGLDEATFMAGDRVGEVLWLELRK